MTKYEEVKNQKLYFFCNKITSETQPKHLVKCWVLIRFNRLNKIILCNNITKRKLYNLHYKRGFSIEKLSKEFDCHKNDILFLFKFFNIKKIKFRTYVKTIKKNVLYDLYINKKMGISDISNILSISSKSCSNLLKKYKIKIRNRSEWWDMLDRIQGNELRKKIYEKGIYSRGKSYEEHLDSVPEYKKYKRNIEKLSIKNIKYHNLKNFNKRGHQNNSVTLSIDHIVPIKFSFVNKISPYLVSDIINLKMINHKHNSRKNMFLTEESFRILKAWGDNNLLEYDKLDFGGFIHGRN